MIYIHHPCRSMPSVEKIMEVDTHIGAAMSGLIPDARTLVDHARIEAQSHRFNYNEPVGGCSGTQYAPLRGWRGARTRV
jgi:20S proteasome alpha/beta subunit